MAQRNVEGSHTWGGRPATVGLCKYDITFYKIPGRPCRLHTHAFWRSHGEVSWAHHVASMIIFTSPFLCVGADPQSILDNPCKEMIQSVPATWDETIVLPQSKIGELVLCARRKDATWFLAAMNGKNETKNISVNLSFLKGNYILSSLNDAMDKQAGVILKQQKVNGHTIIKLKLNAAGGHAGRFTKTL